MCKWKMWGEGSAVLINDNLYHLISLKVNRIKGANQRQGNVDRKELKPNQAQDHINVDSLQLDVRIQRGIMLLIMCFLQIAVCSITLFIIVHYIFPLSKGKKDTTGSPAHIANTTENINYHTLLHLLHTLDSSEQQ